MVLADIVATIRRYVRYQIQLMFVDQLDDHILSDIGLNRHDLRSAAWARVSAR